jgi:digeranylgeranylglycerophospholipid reductase
MCESADITIVGGGPTGLYLAGILAKKDLEVMLIEQHKEIGKPVQCAGLISPRVFEQFQIPSKDIIQCSITRAHIHAPNGSVLTIGGDKIHAYSIDRERFDQSLADQAEQHGARIITNEKVQSIQRMDSHIETCTNKKRSICSSAIVGADGPYSAVRDIFCFPPPKTFLKGLGANLSNTTLDPSTVEIFIGNAIAPGFFAWIIPTNKTGSTARVGLCVNSDKTPKKYFDDLLKLSKVKPFLDKAIIKEYTAGIIPLGPLKQTVDDQVLLVGDAAAQVKPTSGGGIFTGLSCAQLAAEVLISAAQTQHYSKEILSMYHTNWKKTIGRELSIGMKLHKLYAHFSDEQFDTYIEKFTEPSLNKTINDYGDIDYPSKLMKPMLKHMPSLLRFLPGLLHTKK